MHVVWQFAKRLLFFIWSHLPIKSFLIASSWYPPNLTFRLAAQRAILGGFASVFARFSARKQLQKKSLLPEGYLLYKHRSAQEEMVVQFIAILYLEFMSVNTISQFQLWSKWRTIQDLLNWQFTRFIEWLLSVSPACGEPVDSNMSQDDKCVDPTGLAQLTVHEIYRVITVS